MIKIGINKKYVLNIINKQPNSEQRADVVAYKDDLISQGASRVIQAETLFCTIPNAVSFDMDDFLLVTQELGGTVEEFNPKVKILTSNLSNIVPEGIPNRIKQAVTDIDQETGETVIIEPERPKTWAEWVNPGYLSQIDEYSYFNANSGGKAGMVNGQYKVGLSLNETELLIIYNNVDTTLITNEDYQALLPTEEV